MEYARNLLDFSKDVESKYRGAPKFFGDNNQCMVIVWIWSTNRLQRTRNILKSCFPQHHQKFHVIVGQEACQKDRYFNWISICVPQELGSGVENLSRFGWKQHPHL